MTKLYKKSSYEYISSLRPKFQARVDVSSIRKSFAFSNKIVPNKDDNTLGTSIIYSQGSDIYEIDCTIPIESKKEPKPESEYGDAFTGVEGKPLAPKWVYQGETVSKISYLGSGYDTTVLVMSQNGSLGWFKDGIKVPFHIVQEMMGPATSYSAIHSHVRPGDLAVSDFSLSFDNETIVKSQSNGTEEESILKIVDNAGKPSEILRTIRVPGTNITHTVRFFDNHLFASCSDDNVLRFWDVRTGDKPLFILSDPQNGRLTAFDSSTVTNNLFVTGFSTGIVKLWDVRAVETATTDLTNRQNGEDPIQKEIANFYHSGGDTVADVQFSYTSPYDVVTVGGSGNIYHWDMEYAMSNYDEADLGNLPQEASEELQAQTLKFLHTGGSRRTAQQKGFRNTVAYHPVVDGLVGNVDDDGLISIYKPFTVNSE
ncbi:hypothetical protein KAFR_0G01900 [Kazachstania africana CBS 2517]|uniref:Uncharacterized protein n=1 Tax=Kazachstania africana (strain ATCC 22294 / BCRC 22015 / CBS 2517 / CECT 1963 / NBRC 1671 / NRRL Y-8276) TaxID=1071382 RepID=H2AXX4_KAZAF|nr:hypothetical protein KAFR_0G01900 [Kazachstania africana CBS 2517]CCF59224.1 hypothetical protein KAFR_0G01900 [Kazachstania africana CBS 2517]